MSRDRPTGGRITVTADMRIDAIGPKYHLYGDSVSFVQAGDGYFLFSTNLTSSAPVSQGCDGRSFMRTQRITK